jgi:hypothetical protein
VGLAQTVRNVVAVANTVTKDLQVLVDHHVWLSQALDGTATYKIYKRSVLLDLKSTQVRISSGQLVAAKGLVTFLTPTAVSVKDQFGLPDGSVNPVLDVNGFADPSTGRAYVADVYLG